MARTMTSAAGATPSPTPRAGRRAARTAADCTALVAAHDELLRRWLERLLFCSGYTVRSAGDGEAALAIAAEQPLAVVVLARDLPDVDADDVGEQVRQGCALLVVAEGEVAHHPPGLTPPARLGDLEVDWQRLCVRRNGDTIPLSSQDLRLLLALATHHGRVLSRAALLRLVWGCDYLGSSRIVDMAVRRLRERLGDHPARPRYIHTIRGHGYCFDIIDPPPSPTGHHG